MKKLIALSLILIAFAFNGHAAADTLKMQVGGASKVCNIVAIDSVTSATVYYSMSSTVISNPSPDLITVVVDPANAKGLQATAVAGGSGTVSVLCHINYTDPGDGLAKSVDKTISIPFITTNPPQHGVYLTATFN